MSMIWPIALVIFSNIIYQICAKGVPKNMDVMASMTITYLVGAVCSAIMYFVMNKNGNLLQEYMKTNWAPIFLGISVVGLEVGFIYAYKNGCPGWLEVDIEKLSGNVLALPTREQISGDINEQLIVELYSK